MRTPAVAEWLTRVIPSAWSLDMITLNRGFYRQSYLFILVKLNIIKDSLFLRKYSLREFFIYIKMFTSFYVVGISFCVQYFKID